MNDSLGGRMKRYEAASAHTLMPRTPVMIRVDGRAFHTFTRECQRPFDRDIIRAMVIAAQYTAADMAGFRLAYVQSDEASFLIDDLSSLQSQPWFGNKLHKLVSLSASLFTAAFNKAWPGTELATFDSRAFSIPREDAPNAFVWRQRDWERNSLQMLAQSHFTHAQLQGKSHTEIHDMLHTRGVNWTRLTEQMKNGTFVLPGGDLRHDRIDYAQVDAWIREAQNTADDTVAEPAPFQITHRPCPFCSVPLTVHAALDNYQCRNPQCAHNGTFICLPIRRGRLYADRWQAIEDTRSPATTNGDTQ